MSVTKTATAAAAVVAAGFALAAPASASVEVRTDLSPGDIVRDNGVGLVVPAPGQFTRASATQVDGVQTLTAATDQNGLVTLTDVGSELAVVDSSQSLGIDQAIDGLVPNVGAAGAPPTAQPACEDSTYNLGWFTFSDGTRKHYKWKTNFSWWFRAGTTPSNVSTANARDALQRAVQNITGSHNNCGMADEVGATQSFAGDTSATTDINSSGSLCQNFDNTDNKNVVAFGTLPNGTLAYACVWGYKDPGQTYAEATKGDVKFNKDVYQWYGIEPSNCSNRYSIEDVGTHEFGHIFGLGHVGEAQHGNLTMSEQSNGPCQNSAASLGRGDVLGLRVLY